MNLTEEMFANALGIIDNYYRYIGYKNILIKLDKRDVDLDVITKDIIFLLSKNKTPEQLVKEIKYLKLNNIFYRLPCGNYYMNVNYDTLYIELKHKIAHYIIPIVMMPHYGHIITLDRSYSDKLTFNLKLPKERMLDLARLDIHIPDTFVINDDGVISNVLPTSVIEWYKNIEIKNNSIRLTKNQPPIFVNNDTGQKIYISPLKPSILINDILHNGQEVIQLEIYYNYNIYKYIELLNHKAENILSGYIFIPKDATSGLEPMHYEIIGNGFNLHKQDLRELINTAM